MATAGGPDIIEDGLVLALDAANNKGISPAANEEFNNSDQFVKNLIDRSQSISVNNGVKVGNLNYYTAFAISYPEGNYGGSAASRDGITPGFNVTSGTKTYDCSRDLNMFVFNDDTDSWVADSYFNGERVNGHCYDTYDGQPSQHATFQADYDNIKATFPNATYIIIGSHAAENNDNDSATLSRLQELGFPDSQIGVGRPEYILVGKPGENYVYAYENYSVDPGQVAHAVFPLPINKVNKDNYFDFDGTNDYVDLPNDVGYTSSGVSVFCWYKIDGTPPGNYHILCGGQELELSINTSYTYIRNGIYTTSGRFVQNDGNVSLNDGNYHYYGLTYDGSTKRSYIDGVQVGTQSVTGTLTTSFSNRRLGRFGGDTNYYAHGFMGGYNIYNRALTASEVLQNYNATKGRFGL